MSAQESCEPFILLGVRRRERLTQLLRQALEEWRQQWSGGTHVAFEVEVAEALCRRPTVSAGRVLGFGATAGEDRLLALAIPMDAQHELLGLPVPKAAMDGGEAASAVINEAARALCLRLARPKAVEGVTVTTLQAEKLSQAWAPYGLTVTVKTAGDRVLLRARLFQQLLLAMLPTQAAKAAEPFVSRRSAIGIEAVSVQAWLGEAEVPLGDLANLRVGDVILLEANVSGAGRLTLPDGRELAQIRLGSAAGRRAVSVIGKTAGLPGR